ncbi:MAG: D-aminoacyl-tRNA deacylase [Candidatus Nanoarchaeia archaeon]
MYSVITSQKDLAGMNIYNHLKEFPQDNFELIKISGETLYSDVDGLTNGDIIIFATRHASQQKKPCLCVHTPGNWDEAEYGGKDKSLCTSPANLQREAYLELKKNNTLDFEVTMEATHHGPLIEKPCIFIEIGSSLEEWQNDEAGKILAKSIYSLTNKKIPETQAIFGIGGPHYCNNFNKLVERTGFAVGHVCPKYMLEKLDTLMLKQAIEKTKGAEPIIALDWKGLGTNKSNVVSVIEKSGKEYKKIKELIT